MPDGASARAGGIPGWIVYHRGRAEQDRLLARVIAPRVSDAHAAGRLRRFWFDRFGARGPHLFVLLETDDPADRDSLTDALEAYLAEFPSRVEMSAEELAKHHEACRGKALCAVDRLPGMGDPDTVVFLEQPRDAYPFRWTADVPDAAAESFWSRCDELFAWLLDGIATASDAELRARGVRWVAAVDRELRRRGAPAGAFWRHHASTLHGGLVEQLDDLAPEARATRISGLLGDANLASFSQVFAEEAAPPWPGLPGLLEAFPADVAAAEPVSRRLLREVNHWTLKQLGLQVGLHLPLVLFAWLQELQEIQEIQEIQDLQEIRHTPPYQQRTARGHCP